MEILAGINTGLGRIVASEKTGVDFEPMDRTGADTHQAPVMATTAASARFPAIHPLAVIIVYAIFENRRVGIDQPVSRCKKFI